MFDDKDNLFLYSLAIPNQIKKKFDNPKYLKSYIHHDIDLSFVYGQKVRI